MDFHSTEIALMRVVTARRRLIALAAALGAGGGAASCRSATDDGREPRVSAMRLQIGGQQVIVSQTGAITGATIVLRVGTPVAVTAVFTDVNGISDPRVVPGDFRLDIEAVMDTAIVYAPSGVNAIGGTLTGAHATFGVHLRFTLVHVAMGHVEWGPFDVPFVVSN